MNKHKEIQLGTVLMVLSLINMALLPVAYAENAVLMNKQLNLPNTPLNSNSNGTSVKPTEINASEVQQIIYQKTLPFQDIKKGDVITTGKRNSPNDLCQVSFRITTEFGPGGKGSKSIRTIVDNNCNVVVVEKNESQPKTASTDPQTNAATDIYMYGWGGTSDKLTERYSQMTFGWDGNSAWKISGDDGYCWWLPDGWSNTACTYYWNPSSGNSVNLYGEGDFHYLLGSWTHSLLTTTSGKKDGSVSCTYGYTGSIVEGVVGSCNVW